MNKDSTHISSQSSEESKKFLPRDPYHLVGRTFVDRYVIDTMVGAGGMGVVYRADQLLLQRRVAIKILRPDFSFDDKRVAELFEREAMVVAQLNHPNIVKIYDAGWTKDGIAYLVMEWIEGHTLQEEISRLGQLSFSRIANILRQVCSALTHAHFQRIIHRDLKPSNIMLSDDPNDNGRVTVLDFGIAKLLNTGGGSAVSILAGTPLYASPEQFQEKAQIDERTDIYSLGVVLYEMLTGRQPFGGSAGIAELWRQKETDRAFSLRAIRPDIPVRVEDLIGRMLENDPQKRPKHIEEIPYFFESAFDQPFEELGYIGSEKTSFSTTGELQAEISLDKEASQGSVQYSSKVRFWRYKIFIAWVKNFLFGTSDGQTTAKISRVLSQTPSENAALYDNLSVHLTSSELIPEKSRQLPQSTVMLRHSEVYLYGEEHIFEELILHKDYERLWRSLLHARGTRHLLTGYGPFGGTSLVKSAIAKAKAELRQGGQGEGALLVFYFRVTSETAQHFEVEAIDFGFGHVNQSGHYNEDMRNLRAKAGNNSDPNAQIMNFPLNKPLAATFFIPPTENNRKPETLERDYDIKQFISDLNIFFDQRKANRALRNIVMRLSKSASVRSRVVFVIDRIKHLETLETLAKSDLFYDKRTRVITVARKEDVDSWGNIDSRLSEIGFSKWYIPCLWSIDLDTSLFSKTPGWKPEFEDDYKLFLKHLEYKGRGSLGNIIDELKQPSNTNYGSNVSFIDIPTLVNRPRIQHNAWIQHALWTNWGLILGNLFGGPDQDERADRARIGVYQLLDWIAEKRRFTLEEAIEASLRTPVTITDDGESRVEVVDKLLYVLARNRYLGIREGIYQIIWHSDKQPQHRKIKRVRPGISFRRQNKKSEKSGAPLDKSSLLNEKIFKTIVSETVIPLSNQANVRSKDNSSIASQALEDTPPESAGSLNEVVNRYEPTEISVSSSASVEGPSEKLAERGKKANKPDKRVLKTITETVTKKTQVLIEGETTMNTKTNILIVFANPKNSDPLRLGEEDRTIRECIKRSNSRDNLNYKIIHAARIKDVQRELLESEYQIVHFSGHGAPSGQLVLEDENGKTKLVPQSALASLLARFNSIECVVLNACYSLGQGKVLALGVPLVISMDGAISDDAAQHFTRGFYDTIGAGKDFRFAYQMGCDAIALEGYPEESTPKCFEK